VIESRKLPVRGVISGGQTGVDRAALDVALEFGVPIGGWCPAGRPAEDGPVHSRYPLTETPSTEPAQRTRWNVFDADATLLLWPEVASPGTSVALDFAARWGRPCLRFDPDVGSVDRAIDWIRGLPGAPILGVGGPRASEWSEGYDASSAFLRKLFAAIGSTPALSPRRSPTVLVTGGAGLLGSHLLRYSPPLRDVHATWRTSEPAGHATFHRTDLADAAALSRLLGDLRPDLVVHTAYGQAAGERDIVVATRNVVDAARSVDADLIHLSTDMVLDGENAPFDESATARPVNEYGRLKAEAERHVRDRDPGAAVVRASLITTFEPPDPRTAWVLEGLRGNAPVSLFVDEVRSPILAEDLARQIWEIARLPSADRAGVWNLAAPESFSRYGLGLVVAGAFGLDAGPLGSARLTDSPLPRPRDLRLSTARADRSLPTRARPVTAAAAECRARLTPPHPLEPRSRGGDATRPYHSGSERQRNT
jgi:dTDP-4-dehydrorhamnose reductase